MNILKRASDKAVYPVIPLRDGIIFPTTENALLFGRSKSVEALRASQAKNGKVILVMQRDIRSENPSSKDLYTTGVLANISKVFEGERAEVTVLLHGLLRVRLDKITKETPYFEAEVTELIELNNETDETNA